MIITHQVKQGSPAWHALRIQYPHTASLAWILLTRGKNAASNTFGGGTAGFWALRGHILEEQAIEVYNAVYGVTVERPGFITNDDYPDCGYSPDGMLPQRGIEVKSFKDEKHLACLEIVPPEVYAQCQFGMMIAELPECDLIFFNPDVADEDAFKVHRLDRDEKMIDRFKYKLYGTGRGEL